MGRREQPINAGLGPVPGFAHDLRKLRDAAGAPSYRVLAARAHFSASALSAAARGAALPTWLVTRAFVLACGGDEAEWRRRWDETVVLMTTSDDQMAMVPTAADRGVPPSPSAAPPSSAPLSSTLPSAPAFSALPPASVPPAVPVVAPAAAGPPRRRGLLLILLAVLALVSPPVTAVVIAHTLLDSPHSSAPVTTSTAVGLSCAPQGVVAPTAAPATDVPRTRVAFEPGGLIWGPYWNKTNVHEQVVTDHTYRGHGALQVRVGSGLGAVGTVHLDSDLRPGVTVSVHVWYGGQGEGRICPFVQGQDYLIKWVPVAALELSPAVTPGWRTLSWRMPAVARHGLGLQLNNTGAGDLVIELDDAQW